MRTSLRGIANKARRDSDHRFENLSRVLSEGFLLECWSLLNKQATSGVDRVSAREYAEDLEGNVARLVERLKRGSYRARLVRRKEIAKGKGKTRPLGIPVVEDKLLQRAVAVGTPVTRRPPHRSQRALLAHWAPALGSDEKAIDRPGV